MIKLFRPQIEILLRQRDEKIAAWAAAHEGGDVYEDRELEITSRIPVNVNRQTKLLRKAQRGRK